MKAPRLLFGELFFGLRQAGIEVGLSEWMTLMQALNQGAIGPSLEDFYAVARAILVKSETLFDLWDQVFLAVFGNAEMPTALQKELMDWLENPIPPPGISEEELAAMEKMSLEELQKLFEERLKEQTERHDGGNRWIGTGGTSPFGHGGRHPAGIRVGGAGGGRSAVRIAQERRFRDLRSDRVLDTRALSVALKKLRRLSRKEGSPELDIEESIDQTCRNAGELELVFQNPRENQARVLLMMDVGGSMDPFSILSEKLFSAASGLNHWKKFEAFFFHNCPYSHVYESMELGRKIPTSELIRDRPKETYLIVVGDAYMAPYELTAAFGSIGPGDRTRVSGIAWLHRLRSKFTRCVWLTPLPAHYARHSYSIQMVQRLFPMYPLSVEGLEGAIDHLLRRRPEPMPNFNLEDIHRRERPWDYFF